MKANILLPIVAAFAACNMSWGGDCVKATTEPIDREITVSEFTGIVSEGSLDVTLTKGDVQRVVATGPAELLDILATEVKGGVWHISTTKCYSTNKPFSIAITIPMLSVAEVEGSGNITSSTMFSSENVRVGISGSGNIDLQLECKEADVEIHGSGNVELKGTCGTLQASIAGSGDIHASELSCAAAEVSIAGSGDVEVTAVEKLKAGIAGSGDVRYRGRPEVSSDINGSGSVSPME